MLGVFSAGSTRCCALHKISLEKTVSATVGEDSIPDLCIACVEAPPQTARLSSVGAHVLHDEAKLTPLLETWLCVVADAIGHPGTPLVVRTPGGSLQVDDAAFANKVALLRGSFPEAPEEEVSAALLSADYNPLGAKQAR